MACCTRGRVSPVTKRSDARALCAQSLGYHSSRLPQWLLKRLDRNTRHTVASVSVQAAQHSSNGRPNCGSQKFTQEQRSSDIRRRTRWATSLVERARPHDSGSGRCMPRKSSAGRARPPLLEHPAISSTLTVGDDIIADGVSLLNVVRMLGPGEPVRTEC